MPPCYSHGKRNTLLRIHLRRVSLPPLVADDSRRCPLTPTRPLVASLPPCVLSRYGACRRRSLRSLAGRMLTRRTATKYLVSLSSRRTKVRHGRNPTSTSPTLFHG